MTFYFQIVKESWFDFILKISKNPFKTKFTICSLALLNIPIFFGNIDGNACLLFT